jgi:outer membrane biosynthesis protein TonB
VAAASIPDLVTAGETFTVTTPAARTTEAVLVPPAAAGAEDAGTGVVDLDVVGTGPADVQLQTPADAEAPEGTYLLVLLADSGVPTGMGMVQLEPASPESAGATTGETDSATPEPEPEPSPEPGPEQPAEQEQEQEQEPVPAPSPSPSPPAALPPPSPSGTRSDADADASATSEDDDPDPEASPPR